MGTLAIPASFRVEGAAVWAFPRPAVDGGRGPLRLSPDTATPGTDEADFETFPEPPALSGVNAGLGPEVLMPAAGLAAEPPAGALLSRVAFGWACLCLLAGLCLLAELSLLPAAAC